MDDDALVTEKSIFVPGGGTITSDDLIEELFRKRTWKYTVLVLSLMMCWLGGPCVVFITSFAGKLLRKPRSYAFDTTII